MPKVNNAPYKNPELTIDERIEDLMSRMTLEQKIAQLGCVMSVAGVLEHLEVQLANGIGEVAVLVGGRTTAENAALVEKIQKYLVEETDLGIPALIHAEALSGGIFAEATNYPIAIGLGATWDPEKVQLMGDVIRKQMTSIGIRQALSPVMDVARDLRWGRIGETYGEDPTLISSLSVAFVKGIQGDDLKEGVAATAKHFLGYSMSEGALNMASQHLTRREIREVHAKPFEATIRMADLASVMNSYGSLDGEPIISSKEILTDLLRGEMGFKGVTVSDYMAIERLTESFHTAEDITDAGVQALQAGMDIELPMVKYYGASLREAVKQDRLPISDVDQSVRRLLALKFRLGLFEKPYPDYEAIQASYHQPEDNELSAKLANESIVLLKNENQMLPLSKEIKKVAVIGPNGNLFRSNYGAYTFPAMVEMGMRMMANNDTSGMAGVDIAEMNINGGSLDMPMLEPMLQGMYPMSATVKQAIEAKIPAAHVTYTQGCGIMDADRSGFEAAIEQALEAELVIMVMGAKSGWGLGCSIGEGIDSSDIGLPGVQEELIKAVHATQTPMIVVHMSPRPLCSAWVTENIPAIIEAWHPGQSGSQAIANVLFGDYNPGGKLPFTSIRSAGQGSSYYSYAKGSGYASRGFEMMNNKDGYVNETGKPLYNFGHGLSYTDFSYSEFTTSSEQVAGNGNVEISCKVTNVGNREGDEVVQLYFTDKLASMVRPNKELAGFKRITLQPGESKNVTFNVQMSQLAFLNKKMNWIVEAGDIEVMIGSASDDIRLHGQFTIVDGVTLATSNRAFFAEAVVM
ncbi:hypothetical protein A8709_13865 [Paenibacillus pectinilyticus]|uniref:Fibronectin type III-like domain-containing protein n=1 Tax=Paenibacillus pectinilyticus TaxID=512399 RepID=A0A1C1A3Q9_9BACL|nr:glycoside hydrolase family 3 N-terminal domain-containing protein [Paenibacillus pectinilyticus]OCT15185.1 hypothetical protein A8709_13865 [Paenibacillus pectinilyticus]